MMSMAELFMSMTLAVILYYYLLLLSITCYHLLHVSELSDMTFAQMIVYGSGCCS